MREDWIECELGEVGVVTSGGTPSTSNESYWNGNIAWITPADLSKYSEKYISRGRKSITEIGLKNSSARLIPKYSILFSSRAPIGYTVIAANEVSTNQGFKNITPYCGIVSDYVFYFLKASKQAAELRASGTTFKELSAKGFSELPFPLAPLPIQRAIVSKIEALFSDLDNGIANFKKAQEQLKVYRQAVLKKAFEGELTKEWREKQIKNYELGITNEELRITNEKLRIRNEELGIRNEELRMRNKENQENHTNQKNHSSDNLPEGWKWVKLKDLSEVITDGDHQAPPKSDEGIPFITISNVNKTSNRIDFSNTFKVKVEYFLNLKEYRKPRSGDILYTVTGSFGIPIIIDFEKEFCFQRHIGLIRPLKSVNQKYLYYLLQTNSVFNQASETATGTAQKTVALSSLRNFVVPYCKSLQEQTQIVQEIESRLSVTDNLEFVIRDSIEKAEALRQSILKKAFEGKLLSEAEIEQCKKEADYEPAGELLKKITNEKLRIANGKLQMTNGKLRMTNGKLRMTNKKKGGKNGK